jgi:hypothetical protein
MAETQACLPRKEPAQATGISMSAILAYNLHKGTSSYAPELLPSQFCVCCGAFYCVHFARSLDGLVAVSCCLIQVSPPTRDWGASSGREGRDLPCRCEGACPAQPAKEATKREMLCLVFVWAAEALPLRPASALPSAPTCEGGPPRPCGVRLPAGRRQLACQPPAASYICVAVPGSFCSGEPLDGWMDHTSQHAMPRLHGKGGEGSPDSV